MACCYGNWAHFSFMTSFSKSCCIKTSRERVGDKGRMGRLIRREQDILPLYANYNLNTFLCTEIHQLHMGERKLYFV